MAYHFSETRSPGEEAHSQNLVPMIAVRLGGGARKSVPHTWPLMQVEGAPLDRYFTGQAKDEPQEELPATPSLEMSTEYEPFGARPFDDCCICSCNCAVLLCSLHVVAFEFFF